MGRRKFFDETIDYFGKCCPLGFAGRLKYTFIHQCFDLARPFARIGLRGKGSGFLGVPSSSYDCLPVTTFA